MNKEEAKQLIQNGTHQIHNDCDKLELLRYVISNSYLTGSFNYYSIKKCNNKSLSIETIKLSEIEEEPKEWLGSEMEFFNERNNEWVACNNTKYRLRLKPNFDEEIKALQDKAKHHGMNVIIKFEKL